MSETVITVPGIDEHERLAAHNVVHAEEQTQPVNLAEHATRLFGQVSAHYPAAGAVQAATIAKDAARLGVSPKTLLDQLRSRPELVGSLVEMGNSAHTRHHPQEAAMDRTKVSKTIFNIFSLAEEMFLQAMPEAEMDEIIAGYSKFPSPGKGQKSLNAKNDHTGKVKDRLGIPHGKWRRPAESR